MNLTINSETLDNKKKEDYFKCGIYIIRNIQNGKIYVGQSKNIPHRFKQHLEKLINNKHYNKYLQRAFNKYGNSSFELTPIYYCKEEELSKIESYFIKLYKSCNKIHGYNLTEDTSRHIYSTRKQIGITNRELLIRNNLKKIENARKVNQYSLDGKFIKTWKSSKEITNTLNIEIGNLNHYLNNFTTTKSLKDFMWKWFNGNTNDIQAYRRGRATKKILVNNIIFNSINEASNNLNISIDTIRRCLKGIKLQYKGYKFNYL